MPSTGQAAVHYSLEKKKLSLVWGFQGWGSSNTGMRYCQPTLSRDTEASCYTTFCSPGTGDVWETRVLTHIVQTAWPVRDLTVWPHHLTNQALQHKLTHSSLVGVSTWPMRHCEQENLTKWLCTSHFSYAAFKAVQMVRSYKQCIYLHTLWLIQSSHKQSK